ncbi:MAG TPA: nuclear transport factor 2 family protein [bacterium]
MHPNEQLIQKFYSSLQSLDANGMCNCYHAEVVFSDPVFGRLAGQQACAMWRMLCARARDFTLVYDKIQANAETGAAHLEARYTFSKTGRPVHNVISGAFRFREGLIIQHTDTFNLWTWSRMALGPIGLLLGWTPVLQAGIRKNARQSLQDFMQGQNLDSTNFSPPRR